MSIPGYRRPQGTNVFTDYAIGRDVSPYEVDYKSLSVGSRVRFRFLDLTKEIACAFEGREVGIWNNQKKELMMLKLQIPCVVDAKGEYEPDPRLKNMTDHGNTPILACKRTPIFRCPVWVYYVEDPDGKVENYDCVRYLEFTQGLRVSMDKMSQQQGGAAAFNPETGRPDYDVDLVVIKGQGNISKNYEFEPVMIDRETQKPDENFGVEVETVLAGVMEQVEEEWTPVIEAMRIRVTFDEFVQRIAPPKDQQNSRGVSARSDLRQPVEEKVANPPGKETAADAPTRPGSRSYRNRV